MGWTVGKRIVVNYEDNPNYWKILFTEADFDPFNTVTIKVLISRAKIVKDGKTLYPAVFPIFANLYKTGDINWFADTSKSMPPGDNLTQIFTFPLEGFTTGLFTDRLKFNMSTGQFEIDPNNLPNYETRPGQLIWKEGELGDLFRRQQTFKDLDVVTANTEVKRAIGCKLLLKKRGYKHQRELTEVDQQQNITRVRKSNIFTPYYSKDDAVLNLDLTVSVWVPN